MRGSWWWVVARATTFLAIAQMASSALRTHRGLNQDYQQLIPGEPPSIAEVSVVTLALRGISNKRHLYYDK